jgi:predicted nucleotide-binding protein (sugar kinase/HSP70/actin superfamily)
MLIGLPRALHHYEYGVLWRSFFEELGAAVVVSEPTNRATLQLASRRATADLCFPIKVYVGHLLALADRVDLLFVPSVRRPAPSAAHCAKIIGLPDLARSLLPDPSKVLEIDVNLDEGRFALAQAAWRAARPLTWNPVQIARAAESAWNSYKGAQRKRSRGLSRQAVSPARQRAGDTGGESPEPLTLAVVGHPYLLKDAFVNLSLLSRLRAMGTRLLTPDMLPEGVADAAVVRFAGEAYWAYASSLVGAGVCFLEGGQIDGLVTVLAFGCAPDSGLVPALGLAAREFGVPMLTLMLDEHSGDAGLVTRIEAFVDLMERKKRSR